MTSLKTVLTPATAIAAVVAALVCCTSVSTEHAAPSDRETWPSNADPLDLLRYFGGRPSERLALLRLGVRLRGEVFGVRRLVAHHWVSPFQEP